MPAKRLFGNQFPITMERRDGALIRLADAAFYDEATREALVEDAYSGHWYTVDSLAVLNESEFRFATDTGERIVLRPTRPDDAAASDRFTLGIPLPVEIIGAFMSNTITEPTISAAVDDDGDVHTMILETGIGLYARYSRQWIALSDISPIEQLDIVDVPPSDLEHYDMADDLGKTISIRDLTPINAPARSAIGPSRAAPPPPAVTAAAVDTGTLVITSAADLAPAIAWGETHPGARWYISRRWKALGGPQTGVELPWEDDSND